MEKQANKVQFGLKNVHVFPVKADNGEKLEYDVPFRLRGGVTVSLEPAGEINAFYADDIDFYDAISNQGYTGKLTVALITDEFREKILGDKYDDNGLLVESTDNRQTNFGMAFEFNGDVSATRHVLYNVSATRPTIEGNTQEDKTDPDTNELEFTAAPDPYTHYAKAKTTTKTTQKAFDEWYTTIQTPVFSGAGTPPAPKA
ncbi:MAG: phage tail protein [Lactobacillus sp.]|jgi:phi13 family phage major tail protein|nr:phage tail protein [Lactobacillus sp.]